ncbi:3-hydroxymethyl-3-methylglutaryl-CoA lyase, cytoplasmic [Neolecta irregularis DAH-3]|uniref:hydroxymethylglutaryl-CoA lyase n=1 Tax=Neolecta irregularis (strain DAH-3) TaxID=1198029 RepID=A0A1U7LPT8_NEOID|nr:3-hydroxymethyl-3-methylglutaryl-CoA lyase, cytoplasmic [Neolecta irregularis DAH-3]|eukprot:OLL24690.1 3-hydroxymethyl-3-methylglutaryl-CoA lyase, cytoplasmic [Neolecta irregularis DAH-3]
MPPIKYPRPTGHNLLPPQVLRPKSHEYVRIVDVSVRDGLQNERGFVPTEIKCELLDRLTRTGLEAIEATSFVSPKWVPQLADARKVMGHIKRAHSASKIRFPVLVPNKGGLESARAAGATEIAVFASASEGFSRKNINCSIEESLRRYKEVCLLALQYGMKVRGYVSCVIACPYDGHTPPENVLRVSQSLLDMGCFEISLGDTIGVGTPATIGILLNYLLKTIPSHSLAGHFHDTYGQGVANVVKALEMGIRTFDASVGGLGGCPFAKGATGNVAMEDVLYCLHSMGFKTGVNLEMVADIGDWISKTLARNNSSRCGTALVNRRRAKL